LPAAIQGIETTSIQCPFLSTLGSDEFNVYSGDIGNSLSGHMGAECNVVRCHADAAALGDGDGAVVEG
jgi:hypothetical protein